MLAKVCSKGTAFQIVEPTELIDRASKLENISPRYALDTARSNAASAGGHTTADAIVVDNAISAAAANANHRGNVEINVESL